MSHPLAPLAASLLAPMHRGTRFHLSPTLTIILAAAAAIEPLTYSRAAEFTPFSIDTLRSNAGPVKKLINEGLLETSAGSEHTPKPGEKIIRLTPQGEKVLEIVLNGKLARSTNETH